jgi:hypothetical protein
MKFRPKSIAGLDETGKARYLAGVPTLPDDMAARVLVLYHLAEQRPMMGAFLDALGIPHDHGLIQDGHDVRPDPAADVSLYLDTLVCHDPQSWGALQGLTPPPD